MPSLAWLTAPDYWIARTAVQRGLALIYLIAFVNALNQFRPLLGERGLLPVPGFTAVVPFVRAPSLFHFRYSDGLLVAVTWTGIALAGIALLGISELGPVWLSMLVWLLMWALYQSIVNVGQTFYGFGWESLLLEAGFIAIFLGPSGIPPSIVTIFILRWLVFRLEFGAGLIKLRGDPCWRDLTCLYYHHETQPMPNPLSWYFHHLPKPLHRVETLGNHVAQIVVPFGLFLPEPVAGAAGLIIVVTQCWLLLSGNFSWLNAITIVLAFSAFDNHCFGLLQGFIPHTLSPIPFWFALVVLGFTLLIAVLSYWPAHNMVSRRQLMNASFNPFHLVNTYGAFGSITRERDEIIIEGTSAPFLDPQTEWKEYEFKGKPGDPSRRPPQVAPYHLRLDWLMWFAAMGSPRGYPWFFSLLIRLLENDRPTIRLLRGNPFPDRPPVFVRARLYRYCFTSPAARRETGNWWSRTLVGEYVPPVRLAPQ